MVNKINYDSVRNDQAKNHQITLATKHITQRPICAGIARPIRLPRPASMMPFRIK